MRVAAPPKLVAARNKLPVGAASRAVWVEDALPDIVQRPVVLLQEGPELVEPLLRLAVKVAQRDIAAAGRVEGPPECPEATAEADVLAGGAELREAELAVAIRVQAPAPGAHHAAEAAHEEAMEVRQHTLARLAVLLLRDFTGGRLPHPLQTPARQVCELQLVQGEVLLAPNVQQLEECAGLGRAPAEALHAAVEVLLGAAAVGVAVQEVLPEVL
mmetsp:Transcript_59159/g.190276  ORF Transcript_59159/g.190276 Transcript_59159/m.190276 type:complete len:215 (-) Transcript_59159:87-731(-)